MKSARDEFSEKVKRALADRVGWVCSFPGCGASTSGPSHDSSEKSVRNGVAAHICAAAPGGPRYDPGMTSEERSSIENAIWMCPGHGALIDKDGAYSVADIKSWKVAAENRARFNLERAPLPRTQDRDSISDRDLKILDGYCSVLSWPVIQLMRGELFGARVEHRVIDPLHEVIGWEGDPARTFHSVKLEKSRRDLNSRIQDFQRHFTRESAGAVGYYDYINISGQPGLDLDAQHRLKNEVARSQELMGLVCDAALVLLTAKEQIP